MSTQDSGGDRRIRLRRDSQQWIFDRTIAETGRVYHFQPSGRGRLPESVRQHDMASKHIAKQAVRFQRLAEAEHEAGNNVTALEFYFDAAAGFAAAQHAVLHRCREKQVLHRRALECYERVRALSPHRIVRVEVPFDGIHLAGYLHMAPTGDPAPIVFMIPGCDMTKEFLPHPLYNFAGQRGAHLFVFDGPGQGESHLQGLPLTQDNYERATSAMLTHLLEMDGLDTTSVLLYALSFGSYWGARVAATDDRFDAVVLAWASICDKYTLFEVESPRYKQLFAYLTQAADEAELDAFIATMDLQDHLPRIRMPVLLTVGEYDPRSPLDELYELFDLIPEPSELWVFEDQHHNVNLRGANPSPWLGDQHSTATDWLLRHGRGAAEAADGGVKWIPNDRTSPNAASVPRKRHWLD